MSGELRIGEVARLAGTTPRTIRYYEELGLLPAAGERRPGAHRTYAEADVERLTELLRLKDLLGLTLEELKELVEAEDIPYSISASGRGTSTDADVLQISRSGIPTGLVSIPLRYMHSPVEMVDLRDVEAAVKLLAAFGSRISSDIDLSR